MQKRSTPLTTATILVAASSILALITSIFIIYFLQADFPTFPFGGRIHPDFLARIVITTFGLSAFILGLFSVRLILRRKKFVVSVLGATLLLLSGCLFFIRRFLPQSTRFSYPYSWWSIVMEYSVLPLIFCAALGVILLISKMRVFEVRKRTLLTASGAIMILCAITAVLLGAIAYSSYQNAFSHPYGEFQVPFYSGVISVGALVCALISGILFLKKKLTTIATLLTVPVLILGLSLPFIFKFIGYSNWWIGAFVLGLSFTSPIIVLSVIALVLAVYSRRQKNQEELPLSDSGLQPPSTTS